jgi:predicted phosphodiesterase
MKLVIVSDIHSNGAALRAVVDRHSDEACEFVVLGDLLGLLPSPTQTVSLVQAMDTATVLAGNHDRALTEFGEGHVNSDELSAYELAQTRSELAESDLNWVEGLPFLDVFKCDSAKLCAAHAFPYPERASGYESGNAGVRKRDVITVAATVASDYDYVLTGHTHQQYAIDCSKWGHDVTFVNPGSLGWDTKYSVLDTATGEVSHEFVDIDWSQVRADVSANLPESAPSVEEWL